MTLGESLKYYRTKADLTQRAVSQQTGINYKTLSNWENDVSKPSPDDLIALANTYNVSTDYLLGRNVQAQQAEASEKPFDLASFIDQQNNVRYDGDTYSMDKEDKERFHLAVKVVLAGMKKEN